MRDCSPPGTRRSGRFSPLRRSPPDRHRSRVSGSPAPRGRPAARVIGRIPRSARKTGRGDARPDRGANGLPGRTAIGRVRPAAAFLSSRGRGLGARFEKRASRMASQRGRGVVGPRSGVALPRRGSGVDHVRAAGRARFSPAATGSRIGRHARSVRSPGEAARPAHLG